MRTLTGMLGRSLPTTPILRLAACAALAVSAHAAPPPAAASSAVADDATASVDLAWHASDGSVRWQADLSAPTGEPTAGESLTATPWHLRLPRIEVDLMLGGSASIGGPDERVWLIDFWATWCGPCVEELPQLVAMHARHADAGLGLMLVNVGETPTEAIPFVRSLGLEVPVAGYNATLDEALDVEALPTLLLVDRRGEIRGRWDGYRPGLVDEISDVVETILTSDGPAQSRVAGVMRGNGRIRVDWLRGVSGQIEGLTAVPRTGGAEELLVSQGRRLATYGADGRVTRDWVGLPATGQLRLAPGASPGSALVGCFRRGGTSVVLVDLPSGASTERASPDPVFDVAPRGAAAADATVALATIGGLRRSEPGGATATIDESGTFSSLARSDDDGLLALRAGSAVRRLDATLAEVDAAPVAVAGSAWRLVTVQDAVDGWGVLPATTIGATDGRFLPTIGSPNQLALAFDDGRLAIVDAADGAILFEAVWPGIESLAAVDFDGDGVDELAVSTGGELGVLRAAHQKS